MDRGLALVVGGTAFLVVAAIVSRPGVPRARSNDVAALLAVLGAAAVVWGVVRLKKRKDERTRRRRRED